MNYLNAWDDAQDWMPRQVLKAVLGIFLVLYVLSRYTLPSVSSNLEILLALTGLVSFFVYGGHFRRNVLVWFLLGSIILQLANWGWAYVSVPPEWAETAPKIDRLTRLFLFIPIAWALMGSTRNTLVIWASAALGVLLIPWTSGDGWSEIARGFSGGRISFNLTNAQHTAAVYGVVFIGLLAFMPRITGLGQPKKISYGRTGLWVLALMGSIFGIVVTQTRAIWLAVLIVLLIGSGVLVFWMLSRLPTKKFVLLVATLLGATVFLILVITSLFGDTLGSRVGRESEVLEQLLAGNFAHIPFTSIGVRVNTWIAALEFIQQRPVMGWGGNGAQLAIEHSLWLDDNIRLRFSHLHNSYLEVQVRYGLVGTFFFLGLMLWIAKSTHRTWRNGVLPTDMYIFAWAFFIFWMIINFFEAFMFYKTGVYVFGLVTGGLVTHVWAGQRSIGSVQGSLVSVESVGEHAFDR